MTDKLQAIRERVLKANPDKQWEELTTVAYHGGGHLESDYVPVPIRLADLLLAIHHADLPMTINTAIEGEEGEPALALWYRMGDGEIVAVHWSLGDDWDGQTTETKDFLYNLLCA